jgi:hypothetical protein
MTIGSYTEEQFGKRLKLFIRDLVVQRLVSAPGVVVMHELGDDRLGLQVWRAV